MSTRWPSLGDGLARRQSNGPSPIVDCDVRSPVSKDHGRGIGLFGDVADHGDRVALVSESGPISYSALAERVEWAGSQLGEKQRLVAVTGANQVDTIVWYLAALAGRHPVLVLPDDSGHARRIIGIYDPDVVIDRDATPGGSRVEWRHHRPVHEFHPDLALLMSTSGSTGSPKLVRLSHTNVAANASSIAAYLGLSGDDRAITSLPMHYCYGLSVLHSHLAVGASVVLTEQSVIDGCFWDQFRRHGCTSLAGVPHTFDLLDRVGFDAMDLPTLRHVTQAGGRLNPATVRRYAEVGRRDGWDLYIMYGQTEATARIAYLPPHLAADNPTAIGIAVPGGTLTIEPIPSTEPGESVVPSTTADGDVDGDAEGELVYRGPNVMLGYAHSATDLATGRVVHELRTGDLARRTETGMFEIIGRRSRFLKLYGLRIDLDAIEAVLADHAITALCTGDDTTLRIAVETPADPDLARTIARTHMGLPARAVQVAALDALPRLVTGKPDRHHADTAVRAAHTGHDNPTGDVASVFRTVLLVDQVDDRDTFVSLGGDSLAYVEMSVALEDHLGHLPPHWHTTPIGDLTATTPPSGRHPRVETTIVLRAVAITMIVGNHAGWFDLPGTAHVLIAIAGFNFARFGLRATTGRWRTAARIAIPSIVWIGTVAALTTDYQWTHALLVHSMIGDPGSRYSYWFIETLLYLLIPLTALFALPAARRFERARPLATPLAVVVVGLAIRFDLIDLPRQRYQLLRPQEVLWIFALGWATARADTTRSRLLLSALVLAGSYGFFGNPHRDAFFAVGTLLFIWLRTVAIPTWLRNIAVPVASASLYIYLVHWQVLPHLRGAPRPVAVAAGVVAGIIAWRAGEVMRTRLSFARATTLPAHGVGDRALLSR